MAWLHTAPTQPPAPPSKAAARRAPPPTPTRIAELERQGLPPQLPDPGPASHLVSYLFDVGPVLQTGMGAVAITHGELRAWQENVGIELRPWEASTMRRLSLDYLTASHAAQEPACPPFYTDAPTEDRRDVVSRMISATLGARAKAEKTLKRKR